MREHSPLHSVTWLLWAVAAAATVQLAPNPLYVALVVGVAYLVVEAHGRPTALRAAFPALIALGVTFGLLRVLLTALTTHAGGPVAVTLPSLTLPRVFGGFAVGGEIDWPIVLRAAADAFVVVGVMAVFGAFNAVASHDELVRSAPRAFHEPGLVVAVSLAFVPATIGAARAARDADRARTGGRPVRHGRLVRLVIPVLETGMERAVHLAESMDARGFARLAPGPADAAAAWLGLAALLALGASFVALVGSAEGVAAVAALAGIGLLAAAVVAASRAARPARYRPRPLTRRDAWVIAVSLLAPAALVALGVAGHGGLSWTTDPLRFPVFSLAPALAIGLLAIPAVVPR